VKSSGLCVSTGTGSTSWHLSINRITEQSVAEVLKLLGTSHRDPGFVKHVTDEFNQNLVFICGMSAFLISLIYIICSELTSLIHTLSLRIIPYF
jgi:hypothetical protein